MKFKINGTEYREDAPITILKAARKRGIRIPTLCSLSRPELHFEHLPSSCRVCLVKIQGKDELCPACSTEVTEGMEILTDSPRVIAARKTTVSLLLSDHPNDCVVCPKNGDCRLQDLAKELGIREIPYPGKPSYENRYTDVRGLFRNPAKCIRCYRCVAVCDAVQGIRAISPAYRNFKLRISDPSKCITCGQCVQVCPTGALLQSTALDRLEDVLNDPTKTVVIQTAPATRVTLGEAFHLPAGTDVSKKMAASLKAVGFDRVFDTNFGADLTVMEEADELLRRLETNQPLPIITSCCPGWIKHLEIQYPDLLHLPSSCKSPMEMLGAMIKTYYAEKEQIDPKSIVSVALMPCLAKKREADREELANDGLKNVDLVITVKEYAELLKRHGILLNEIEDAEFDSPFASFSGGGAIFAHTGGVMESVVRRLSGNDDEIRFSDCASLPGVREATIDLNGRTLRLGIVSGLKSVRAVLDEIRKGEHRFDAIEVMACPGGCLNGGGQIVSSDEMQDSVLLNRKKAVSAIDKKQSARSASENEAIQKIYEEFLGKPGSEKAHELLHTRFHDSSKS